MPQCLLDVPYSADPLVQIHVRVAKHVDARLDRSDLLVKPEAAHHMTKRFEASRKQLRFGQEM